MINYFILFFSLILHKIVVHFYFNILSKFIFHKKKVTHIHYAHSRSSLVIKTRPITDTLTATWRPRHNHTKYFDIYSSVEFCSLVGSVGPFKVNNDTPWLGRRQTAIFILIFFSFVFPYAFALS